MPSFLRSIPLQDIKRGEKNVIEKQEFEQLFSQLLKRIFPQL
jgi:hypothetical protein